MLNDVITHIFEHVKPYNKIIMNITVTSITDLNIFISPN